MFFRFLLAFLTIFLLELYLLIKLGGIISALNVIGLIILTAIIGIVVAKEQWVRFARDIENHTIDDKEGADRILKYFCITIGAISLIIPGILSDLLGLLLIFPLTRKILANLLKSNSQSNMFVKTTFHSSSNYYQSYFHEIKNEKKNQDDNIIDL